MPIPDTLKGFVSSDQIEELLKQAIEGKEDYDKSKFVTPDEAWKVVEAYIQEYGLIRSQIESYNFFVDKTIKQLIDSLPVIEAKCNDPNSPHRYETHKIKFSNPVLSEPHIVEQVHHYLAFLNICKDSRKKITVDERTKSVIKDTSSVTPVTPKMTRDRKGTYAGKLFVECTHTITTNKPGEESKSVERKYPAMGFGYIPIMVKSDYCPLSRMSEQELCDVGEDPYDLGGYLIAGGVEKVLIGQERMQNNFPFVFKKTSSGNKPIYEAEVRSLKEMSLRPASLIGLRYKSAAGGPTVRITALPYLRQGQDIPLGVMFKALGILNDKDMCFRITNNLNDQKMLSILRATIREGNKEVKTQEEALNYIGMRTTNMEKDKSLRVQYVKDLLTRDLLPHMGDSYEMKSYYLGFMTQELLNVVIGRKEPVDRDNYGRKRVSHAGQLLGELFAQILQKVMKDLRGMLNKYLNEGRPIDVSVLIKEKTITQGLKYSISTGNWSANKIAGNKKGVSAVLSRLSFLASLSHLRRLNTPVGRDGKLSKPRHLSGTHWGRICPAETPEGQSVGLVKNLALLTHLSLGDHSSHFHDVLYANGLKSLLKCTPNEISDWYKVMVNGAWMGMVENPVPIVRKLTHMKRYNMALNYETEIVHDRVNRQIRIVTDGGRTLRPVFVVENGKLKITKERIETMCKGSLDGWLQLQREGLVEYIDVDEEDDAMIAMFPWYLEKDQQWTHCEIHPATILGIAAGSIPFPHHNPAARNTFQCLREEEPILMADGTKKPIKNVKIGDEVITFHPDTLKTSITKVTNHFIRPTSKVVYKISIPYGRSVVATTDHKFMTDKGWVEAGYLEIGQKLCIFGGDSQQTRGDMTLVPISDIKVHENVMVADITTESDNHSFITGDGFAVHNCAMVKQAIGICFLNFGQRMDTLTHLLWYPQKPIVTTKTLKLAKFHQLPAGINAVVAVCSYSGYSEDDAVIMNSAFIQRGGQRSTSYRLYSDEEKKLGNHHSEQFEKPDKETCYGRRQGSYEKIDEDGISMVGSRISSDDILIGKTSPMAPQPGSKFTKIDHSTGNRSTESGIVDKVMLTTNAEGFKFAKVSIRTDRVPHIGDKFSSRHGQKGVMGMEFPPEDMPFSASGIIPDMLVNPQAFTGRMTIGHLLESAFGKAGCIFGKEIDATAFEYHNREEEVETILQKAGFQKYGKERLYNGQTGMMMDSMIYFGIVYYQRLKHLVDDKIHSRSRGPVNILTRQPVEGRAKDGGLRFGEMERDCMIAHGASAILNDKMMGLSDKYECYVCNQCGLISQHNENTNNVFCKPCRSSSNIHKIRIPYACKLLFQELISMCIVPRIMLDVKGETKGHLYKKDPDEKNIVDELLRTVEYMSIS